MKEGELRTSEAICGEKLFPVVVNAGGNFRELDETDQEKRR
jgi:hypothetical protein